MSGPRNGETFSLDTDTTIGRMGQIRINSDKLSKQHAIFRVEAGKSWYITDLGSKNGTTINDLPTTSALLKEGDMVGVGNIKIRVLSLSAAWKPHLDQLLLNAMDAADNSDMKLEAFRTIPVVSVIQGIQFGEKHVLEYGPRVFGGETDDVPLFEPLCPDIAFKIKNTAKGAQFTTQHPGAVKINGRALKTKLLKRGDKIEIRNTVLEIDFINL